LSIRLLTTDAEMARCFPVLRELRPHLGSVDDLLAITRVMQAEGAEFAALEEQGEIATVAAFRLRTMLVSGRTLYVDDLVTAERFRSRGHRKRMLGWLMAYARERGCAVFSLDSGTFRQEAHAFYFREGMRITAFHFQVRL
jgi:GNAT superfamily N-acetyltransferase